MSTVFQNMNSTAKNEIEMNETFLELGRKYSFQSLSLNVSVEALKNIGVCMMKLLILCGMLLFSANELLAQSVTGRITDANTREALPGVNVVIKGTFIGTSTDVEGVFRINAPSLNDTLIVSYIGYQTEEIPIDGRLTVDIAIQEVVLTGAEVVVIGYGVQDRANLTSSISSLRGGDITKTPAFNIGNTLAGKVTGVQITQYSGQPGGDSPEIFLRGIGSLSTGRSGPLIIVDGVARDMFQLEPDDIESISILKDASATAVYGIEGANGVIVVQTRRGSAGRMNISARFSAGIQEVPQHQKFADSYTSALLFNESQRNDGVREDQLRFSPEAVEAYRTNSFPEIFPNINWVDYLTKPAAYQTRSSVNISGGTKDVKYFVSGGYMFQDGMFRTFESDYDYNDSFERYSFRANLDLDVTETTRVSVTSNARIETRMRPRSADGLWTTVYRGAPFASAGIVDGKYTGPSDYIAGGVVNPLGRIYGNGFNQFDSNVLNVDLGARQQLDFVTRGLEMEVKGSYNTAFSHNKFRNSTKAVYTPFFRTDVDPTALGDSTIVYRKAGRDGALEFDERFTDRTRDWYAEARLQYTRSFGMHTVSGLLLHNRRRTYYPIQFTSIPRGLVSTISRINHNYDNRYLLEASMGYNGSENFAEGNRFGFFPAVSGGWIVTNENFMRNVQFLNELKFRVSYGVVGNDTGIGRFLYLPGTYSTSAPGYNFGNEITQFTAGAAEETVGNPLVQWETARKQNYGVDVQMFQERLSLTFDYFYEYRDNILININTIPAFVAANLPAANLGEVENKGYEVSVRWRDQLGNFSSYHISANMSFARNEIIYMDEVLQNENYLQRTGHPVGQIFGYIFDGFFSEEDLLPGSGVPQHPYQAQPGDLKFKDLNGDGVINSDDQQPIGFPEYPEYTFGAEIGYRYKNFDIASVWSGATNVSRLLVAAPYRIPFCAGGQCSIMQWMADGRWTPETADEATFPRLTRSGVSQWSSMNSDFWIRDASYIRLKSVEVGYNFRSASLNNFGIRSMRVYMNGYNLLTFSKLKIIDPEQTARSADAAYPLVRIYNFGINLNF